MTFRHVQGRDGSGMSGDVFGVWWLPVGWEAPVGKTVCHRVGSLNERLHTLAPSTDRLLQLFQAPFSLRSPCWRGYDGCSVGVGLLTECLHTPATRELPI